MNKKGTLREFFINKFMSGSMMGAGISAILIHYYVPVPIFTFAIMCFIVGFIMFMFAKD